MPHGGALKVETLEGEPIPGVMVTETTFRHPADYYVCCFSRRFQPRLFADGEEGMYRIAHHSKDITKIERGGRL